MTMNVAGAFGPKKRYWGGAVLLLVVLLTGGCWDNQPPETTAFVLMVGIDADPEDPSKLTMTQMIALPRALAAGGAEGGNPPEGTPFYLLSATDYSAQSAQTKAIDHISRLLRLDHMSALVLGEDFARSGISHTIGWVVRNPQVRLGSWLLVSEEPAQMFMDAGPALDRLPGEAVLGLLRQVDRVPVTKTVRVYEFAKALLSPRKDGFAPLVRRVDPLVSKVDPDFTPRPFAGQGTSDNEPHDTQIQVVGLALFKGDRMVGSLKGADASGVAWIAGTSKAPVTVLHPFTDSRYLTALAIKTRTKKRAKLIGGQLRLYIDVTTTMDMWETGVFESQAGRRHQDEIKRALTEQIHRDIRQTMTTLQSFHVDVFGFGEELYRGSPRDWERVADVWDELYAQAELEISVHVHVPSTGLAR